MVTPRKAEPEFSPHDRKETPKQALNADLLRYQLATRCSELATYS